MRWVAERVSHAAAETPSEAWRANKQIEAALVRFSSLAFVFASSIPILACKLAAQSWGLYFIRVCPTAPDIQR